MIWDMLKEWFLGLGAQYGVDPVIFGSIYVGAIPFFGASVAWLVRNLRHGQSILLPALAAAFFALSAYLYLFLVGMGLPAWVYGAVGLFVAYGAVKTVRKVRRKTAEPTTVAPGEQGSTATASAGNGAPRGRSGGGDYDLVVIGGGAAGLTAAGAATNLGAKTFLIERQRLGGDCTWHGCVPSKALLTSAKVAHHIRHAEAYGLAGSLDAVDFQAVMGRVRRVREGVYDHDDHPRHFEAMGVDVMHGSARFTGAHTLAVEGEAGARSVRGRYVVIAAGARASVPPIEGLSAVPYLTNETLFDLTEQPRRLAIVGGGPIGVEMAQAFARLGTAVTLVERGGRLLPNDDAELAGLLHEQLAAEGVEVVLEARVERVGPAADGAVRVEAHLEAGLRPLEADALLMATGRQANVEGLDLEAAGVKHTLNSIPVDERCRTNKRHIYAIGDVTGRYQFTHMGEHMAKVAVTNALLKLPMRMDAGRVPWVTYTDPELAHVGATEAKLKAEGAKYAVYRFPYSRLDRAVMEGETTGLIKVFAKPLTGKILGATILGARAGELISEYALAMKRGATLRQIADTIHPYPSYGLGARRAADQWYAQKQSPRLTRLLQRVFGYRGPVIAPDPDRIV